MTGIILTCQNLLIMCTTINKLTDITLLICAPQNEDVKSDTSAGTPLDYTSDETDKINISHACTSSDVVFPNGAKEKEGSQEKTKMNGENGEQLIRNCQ